MCIDEGRPVESDDPFHVFLKEMAKEREKKRKDAELAEKVKLEALAEAERIRLEEERKIKEALEAEILAE